MKDKKIIVIAILSFLLMCQTCSKCSSERQGKVNIQEANERLIESNEIIRADIQRFDSLNSVIILLQNESKMREEQIRDLKEDKNRLNKQNSLLLNK